MSKVSFVKGDSAPAIADGTAAVPTPTAPVVIDVQAQTVAPVTPAASIPSAPVTQASLAVATTAPLPVTAPAPLFDDENISFDDIIVPRLNIVQKVGDLSEKFNTGEIVLSQTLVIHEPANKEKNKVGTGPLVVIPLGFKKTAFVEKVKGGGRGAYCLTREAVVAAGGTLDYREWKASLGSGAPKKRFEQLATALVLIQRPEHIADEDHQVFNHEVEGKFYALAFWSMKGTAYTHAAKRFFTERKIGFLKNPRCYPSFAWTLTTKVEPFAGEDGGTNYAVIPIITPGPKSSEALLTYVRDGIGLG